MPLGKDLAFIRKSQNLSLEDIQNAIKIPLDTLKSIEDESIFTDPKRNTTYLRSFVRSYGKVLKIEDDVLVRALDDMQAGTYKGNLLGQDEPEESSTEEKPAPIHPPKSHPTNLEESEEKPESGESLPETTPQKDPLHTKPVPTIEEEPINWADMGRQFTTVTRQTRAWLIISVVAIVILLALGSYFFWDDITTFLDVQPDVTEEQITPSSNTGQNGIIPTPIDSTAILEENTQEANQSDLSDETPVPTQKREAITLGDTLTLAVYAAYGQLEPVRITSDLNWRTNPFWMETGEAYKFDFRDTLLVHGQYSRLLLLFNGHVIENPRQNYFNSAFNSIMITRAVLNQPRYLAPPPQTFPLNVGAPDSTVYRLRF
jgi:hypothetical protein